MSMRGSDFYGYPPSSSELKGYDAADSRTLRITATEQSELFAVSHLLDIGISIAFSACSLGIHVEGAIRKLWEATAEL
jgi:hypothetical protein